LNRREFVKTGTAAGFAAATVPHTAFGQAPAVATGRKPIVISSSNGHRFKNGGQKTGVETAFASIVKGDDVLDAVIAGVNIVELDPEDTSVGYGGLPNADGIVQLDSSELASVHGTLHQAMANGTLDADHVSMFHKILSDSAHLAAIRTCFATTASNKAPRRH